MQHRPYPQLLVKRPQMQYPGVAQLVARMVRVHEAVGSTPATRTIGEFRRDSPIFYVNCWVLKIFDLASREDSYK